MCVIRDDPTPILQNLIGLLSKDKTLAGNIYARHQADGKLSEPGGYLQWGEMDPPTSRFEQTDPQHPIENLKLATEFASTLASEDSRMNARLDSHNSSPLRQCLTLTHTFRWINGLSSYFKKAGMKVLANEHKFRDPCHLPFYTDVAFMVWEEWRSKMSPENARKFGGLIEGAKEEVHAAKRGISLNMEIRSVVGQKPLNYGSI
jgi:hypothetical protein